MPTNYSSLHQELLSTIIAAAKNASTAQKHFIESFYALSPVGELEEIDPAPAATIALTCEAFVRTRDKKGPKLSVEQFKSEESGRVRTRVMALNDDMPFLVDSLSALFTSLGLSIHLILHPLLAVGRDKAGKVSKVERLDVAALSLPHESLIYVELSPLPMSLSSDDLIAKMEETLEHVRAGVADWRTIRSAVIELAKSFPPTDKKSKEPADIHEINDLLTWLASNHFIFLGYADFDVAEGKKEVELKENSKSALGIYRLKHSGKPVPIERGTIPTASAEITVLKASEVSRVHRRVHMDYIAIRRHDAKGRYIGETRILGLFTSTVYYREVEQIPFIRTKAARVMARAGFSSSSHSGKSLKTALEFLPREELFQMDEESLFAMAMKIVSLDARPQVRLFVRRDAFERFISAMVYVPRERLSTELRQEIIRLLEQSYHGTSSFYNIQVIDSPLSRITIEIETTPGKIPDVSAAALEERISSFANVWSAALHDAIINIAGDSEGQQLAQTFANAFPPAYVNTHGAQAAAFDIRRVQESAQGDGLALELFRRAGDPDDQLHLKCFTRDLKSELSSIIPLLEHMGCTVVDATPYTITPLPPFAPVLMRDFTLRVPTAKDMELGPNKERIEAAIAGVWRGSSDNDTLNALVFSAQLAARDVEILRAYSRYLQQLDFPYSQPFIATALNNHAAIARMLVELFHARFNPKEKQREVRQGELKGKIEAALENITNLAEDRVIRRLLALLLASLRTNFYQTMPDGAPKSYLSIKMRSKEIPGMPLPVPYAEIFVTSMRVEGIHLRGGPVARGGLRWSDRPEDFRTEVLGLVKAQMVKNAVIVPTGAKGGFILRKPPEARDALQAEGIYCYQMFLKGLLDITDNIIDNKLTPPSQVVRHDEDDPYLVVAADKGTATFSDIANEVAASYRFWLGDAFASGGSAGYDHKVMAITARGGWVSVERHFREMGKDIGKERFTCVGIGDMSGDVFGNGMLLSDKMQLVAAFNHRHIFVDPTPDPEPGFAERERLFKLPRSGWNDYDAKLISKGGGIFERSAKSIKLTPEMKAALGTDAAQATPDELIRIILKSPVDLLWNGGIGTYVKAMNETHEQVGDRTNASLRINGRELRCKVVGEGGNLGFTQRGRIEYARAGGRINTDAIDNSGGVDCSDHEVNIKIALGAALAKGAITLKQRDMLLKKMTGEVARLVLVDNRLQTQAISVAQLQGPSILDPAEQLITALETSGILNREVEFLPDAKAFGELRANKQGLTRPEIAVLLAYAKMSLFGELQDSKLLDAPYFEADLLRYFPKPMQEQNIEEIRGHRLRRPIVATMITNSIVNRAGFFFAYGLMRATGLPAGDIAQAYVATRDVFGARALWTDIEALDGKVNAALQSKLFSEVNLFIEHCCRWFLQHVSQPMDMALVMKKYAVAIREIEQKAEIFMTESLRKSFAKSVEDMIMQGVPEKLANRIAKLEILASACDIIDVAGKSTLEPSGVGLLYFELGAQLKLGWLRHAAQALSAENYWQQLAIKSLVQELYLAQRKLTQDVIARFAKKKGEPAGMWMEQNREPLGRYQAFLEQLRTQQSLDYPMLIVALRQVQWITSQ